MLFLAGMLAACSATEPAGSGTPFDGSGIRFVAPPGWDVRRSSELRFGPISRVAYIANQPLHDDCTSHDPQACPGPIGQLRDDGVLLSWATTNCAGPQCVPPDGALTTVGGRMATIVDLPVTVCGAIGSTKAMAYQVAVSPQRLDTIVVCARSPSGATRLALATFLGAVDWRTP